MLATMLTLNIFPIFVCLQMAAAIPFVTNARTGISYQGTSADSVEQFQNISYAQDTSGANRFAPPVPYLPARGSIVQATGSGFACPQLTGPIPYFPFISPSRNVSEDCLTLRIARPADHSPDEPLPVMVWIYGGGWVYGEAYDRVYEPVDLVQESVASGHPVIYAAINYRVGLFGFAASKALHDAKSENNGLRDQRLALQWVKDNIAAFGGDPDKITVFGQSAGALSTGLQTVAYGGQQGAVFQRAIMDSGSIIGGDYSTDLPANITARVVQSLNCSGNDPDSDASLACLRKIPLETLLPTALEQTELVLPSGIGAFHAVVDGDFIPDLPWRLILEGSFVKGISTIASWVADDGSEVTPTSVNSEATVVAFLSRLFSNSTRDQVLSLYPVEEFEAQVTEDSPFTAQYYRASRIYRDYGVTCPSINFTSEIALQSTSQSYLFTLNSTRLQPVWDSVNESEWHIGHTSDIPYVFNEDIVGGDNSKAALQLSAEVSSSFSAFATYGDPSTPVFDWPAAWSGRGGSATVFVIGGPYGSRPATLESTASSANDERSKALAEEKLVERCAFLNSVIFSD